MIALLIPVLVELFTSEGCSSCPPADELLLRLSQQSPEGVEVIALGEHVDYWDRLGWKDRFASPRFSQRQQWYGGAIGFHSAYTPQAVVDGRIEFVGNDGRRMAAALKEAARTPKARVTIAQSGGAVAISVKDLPAGFDAKSAEVWLAVTESGLETQVARGENGGRRLRHAPVVRRMENLGAGERFEQRLEIDSQWSRPNLRVVAFVQDRKSGRVAGAASARLE